MKSTSNKNYYIYFINLPNKVDLFYPKWILFTFFYQNRYLGQNIRLGLCHRNCIKELLH